VADRRRPLPGIVHLPAPSRVFVSPERGLRARRHPPLSSNVINTRPLALRARPTVLELSRFDQVPWRAPSRIPAYRSSVLGDQLGIERGGHDRRP